jgi:hypothetical protein
MAKKRVKQVQAVKKRETAKPVRLDLSPADHARLEHCARERGLSKSSYARMAVLERLKADEGK